MIKVDFICLQWWQNPIEACFGSGTGEGLGSKDFDFSLKLNFLRVAWWDRGDMTSLIIGLLLICLCERLMSSRSILKQASSCSLIHVSGKFKQLSKEIKRSKPRAAFGGLAVWNLFFWNNLGSSYEDCASLSSLTWTIDSAIYFISRQIMVSMKWSLSTGLVSSLRVSRSASSLLVFSI